MTTNASTIRKNSINYLKNKFSPSIFKLISLGLPEYSDRTKEWRVAVIYSDQAVGFLYFNFDGEKLNYEKSSNINLMEQKIKNIDPKIKRKKRDNTFYISSLDSMYINGDSLYELKQLPDNSIDMVFTSPPYYNAKTEYSEYDSYDNYLDFIQQIIHEIKRVLIPGKFFIIDSSPVLIPRIDRSHSSTRIGVPFDIHGLFVKEGYEFIDDIIWEKPEGAGWASGRGRRFAADRNPMQYKPVPVTENIMVYRNGTDHLIDWYIRKHPNQKLVQDSKIGNDYEKTNIWKINPATDKRHPAIFPRELAKKVIQYYSFKNDIVLDPFGGLATTAKAALELDRRFVSIELNSEYYREGLKDLDEEFSIYLDNIIIKK